MKHLTKLIPAAALALMALGCQREQVVPDSPLYNPETKEVTTEFVLNIASTPQTKQTAEVVQQDHNFRGMDNAKVFVYTTGMVTDNPSTSKDAYVLKTTGWTDANSKVFDLGTLYSASSVTNTGEGDNNTNNKESSNRVLQLSIPVGTDAVMVYGKAIKGNNAKSADYGGTNMSATKIDKNPSETIIAAQKILDTEAKVTAYDATASLMIYLINDILGMEVPNVLGPLYGFPGTTYSEGEEPDKVWGHQALSWDALGHQYEIQTKGADSRYKTSEGFGMGDHTINGLEEVLGRCYFLFTDMRDGEYRTGSSGAVKRMIADMYKVIKAASDATPTNEYEANAKRLAVAILNKAKTYFSIEDSGDYFAISELKTTLGTTWKTEWDHAMDLNGYPFEDFGIPRGAAQLGFFREGAAMTDVPQTGVGVDANGDNKNDADVFYYLHPNKPLVNSVDMDSFEPRKYLYPAELWYYVNSPIRVTNKTDLLTSDYPNGVYPWKSDDSWAADGWVAKGKVESSTRGVAVKNSINYGVALLKTTVQLADDSYFDNRAQLTDDTSDREILKSNLKLELHGVLVGGVNPRMNWQFTRYYTTAGTPSATNDLSLFDGVIYDSSIESKAVPTVSGEENYTLVYDNYNSDGTGGQADQNKVYIALEFKNNGDAFWGKHNLIPKDGYFYLVGLIPAPYPAQINSLADKWPTDHQIPPVYDVNETTYSADAGQSKKIARGFMQDFMTSVTFKITESSLKNAYYTMPDLRAAQMSLGLSVDLQWIPGLEYDDIEL